MGRPSVVTKGVRTLTKVSSLAAALLLGLGGCQAITGSYSVGTATIGPICTELVACCTTLTGANLETCLNAVKEADETVCGAVRTVDCSVVVTIDSGTHPPDGQTRSDGGSTFDSSLPPGDAVVHDDVVGPKDVTVPVDTGKDTGEPASDLTGTWTLQTITCEGQDLTTSGSTTLTFSSGSLEEVDDDSDGCVQTTEFDPDVISSTDITSSASSTVCGSSCTSTDECPAGAGGGADFAYTLSGGTLSISDSVPTTTCASGTILFNFTMD